MIECILPPSVQSAEIFGDELAAPLFPEEQAIIAGAGERRRQEFVTARACAHAAMARLGLPPAPVRSSPRGAPLWPDGVTGSITHCAGYRAAAVAAAGQVISLGLDATPNQPLRNAGLLSVVARRAELDRLAGLAAVAPGVCWDQALFSAKESVYKAWFPLAGCWLDFEDADVVFDPRAGTFTATLLVPGPVVGGSPLRRLRGRWLAGRGLVLTAVIVRSNNDKCGKGSHIDCAETRSHRVRNPC